MNASSPSNSISLSPCLSRIFPMSVLFNRVSLGGFLSHWKVMLDVVVSMHRYFDVLHVGGVEPALCTGGYLHGVSEIGGQAPASNLETREYMIYVYCFSSGNVRQIPSSRETSLMVRNGIFLFYEIRKRLLSRGFQIETLDHRRGRN